MAAGILYIVLVYFGLKAYTYLQSKHKHPICSVFEIHKSQTKRKESRHNTVIIMQTKVGSERERERKTTKTNTVKLRQHVVVKVFGVQHFVRMGPESAEINILFVSYCVCVHAGLAKLAYNSFVSSPHLLYRA